MDDDALSFVAWNKFGTLWSRTSSILNSSQLNKNELEMPTEFADVLAEFLEVAIHQRSVNTSSLINWLAWETESFTRRKKYDTPVQMSRLPQVHEYICNIVTNLKPPLANVRSAIPLHAALPPSCTCACVYV
jgi:hypothetical protein